MPLTVRASVVDLRRDAPRLEDRFLVDSNVWLWLGYSKASISGKPYQVHEYPAFLLKVVSVGGKLGRTAFAFAEAAHVIEKKEHEMFDKAIGAETKLKEFRNDYPKVRANVLAEIQAMWSTVKTMSEPLISATTDSFIDGSIATLAAGELDEYDGFLVQIAKQMKLTGIITDDADMASAPGVTVFTANTHALTEARKQGKLVTR